MAEPPNFVARSELLEEAYAFACAAHHGPARRGDTDIEHPAAVAALLADAGFGDAVVAAGLLHDVVEDTTKGFDVIDECFGVEIGDLVDAMTEDDSIDSYAERKAEHRQRALAAGPAPASIYAADKLARVRSLTAAGESVAPERLAHYRDTLALFGRLRPELPFLDTLAVEFPELEAAQPGARAPGAGQS